MSALTCGKPVDLRRLCAEADKNECGPPSKTSWDKVVETLEAEGVDPVEQWTYQKAEIIKVILPVEGTKEYKDRTPLVRDMGTGPAERVFLERCVCIGAG